MPMIFSLQLSKEAKEIITGKQQGKGKEKKAKKNLILRRHFFPFKLISIMWFTNTKSKPELFVGLAMTYTSSSTQPKKGRP